MPKPSDGSKCTTAAFIKVWPRARTEGKDVGESLKKFYGDGMKNVLVRVNIALAGLELWRLPYCFG